MHRPSPLSLLIRPRGFVLLGLFVFCLLAPPSGAGWVTQKPFVGEGSLVWYTDGGALYRYNRESRDWIRVSVVGFEEGTIYDIGVDDGLLWLATDQGVYRFDIRLETWLHYGKEVLGTDRAFALAFGEDFVWIAGEGVLARFDNYVETWETLDIFQGRPAGAIRDMEVGERTIWLVTEIGIVRYDQQFHQVRTFSAEDGALSGEIRETFAFGGEPWFWGDQGLCRYEAELETWTVYGAEQGLPIHNVREIASAGGRDLWLISSEAVFRFDGRSEKWAPFVDVQRLEGRSLHAMAYNGKKAWFGTDNGLYGYEIASGEWDILREADGLSSDEVLEVFIWGDLLFCVHRDGIDVYDGKEWRAMPFAKMKRSYRAPRMGIALEEDGLSIRAPRGNAVRLGGRTRWAAERKGTYRPGEGWWSPSADTRFKAASILSGEFSGGRTWGGYYDDTDPDDVRFGGAYRGAEGDMLRRVSGGEIRAEAVRYGASPFEGLGGTVSLIGGEAQMMWDERHPWALRLWGGRGRSRFAQEFFRGADGPFFRLAHRRIVPGSLRIRIDGEVIAPRVYTVSPSLGVLFFRQERFVAPDSEIEAFYEYEDDDLEEDVLRGQIGWEVSETLSLGANGCRRWGEGSEHALDIGEVYGQLRWRSAARDLDLKLIPEVAFSRVGGESAAYAPKSGGATQLHLIAVWSDLQFNGVWKEFGEGFGTIGQRELAFGAPRRIVDLSSRYHIQPNLPLDLEWRREEAREGREDRWSTGMLLSKALWPQASLKFARTEARSSQIERSVDQWTVLSRWDLAQLPPWTGRVDRLLLQGQYQQTEKRKQLHRAAEGLSPSDSLSVTATSRNAWLSLDLMPEDRLSCKTDLWWSRVEDQQESHRWIGQFHAYDVVPGILAFAQLDGGRSARFEGDLQEVSFDGMLLFNAAVRPGTWFDVLRWMTLYPTFTWSRRGASADAPRRWNFLRTLRETWPSPLSAAFIQGLRMTLNLGSNWSLTEILSQERQEKHTIQPRQKARLERSRKDMVVSRLDLYRGDDRLLLRHEFVGTEAEGQTARRHDASIRWGRRWSGVYRTDGELRYKRERTGYKKSHSLTPSIELFSHVERSGFFDDIYLRPAVSFQWKRSDHTVDHRWTGRLRLDLDFLRALSQRLDIEATYREGDAGEVLEYEVYAQLRADF